jgi:hypothetical protein
MSTRDITKTERKKRPPEPGTPIMVRMQSEPLRRLDNWASHQHDKPSRPEAIRRLIELGLSGLTTKIPRIVASVDALAATASKAPAAATPARPKKARRRRS